MYICTCKISYCTLQVYFTSTIHICILTSHQYNTHLLTACKYNAYVLRVYKDNTHVFTVYKYNDHVGKLHHYHTIRVTFFTGKFFTKNYWPTFWGDFLALAIWSNWFQARLSSDRRRGFATTSPRSVERVARQQRPAAQKCSGQVLWCVKLTSIHTHTYIYIYMVQR
jgi:hypothetical protein